MFEAIYLYLDLTGYKIKEIKGLKINHDINEHSRLYLSAVLDGEAKLDPVFSTQSGTQIGLTNKNREYPTIFQGMVQTIQVKHLSGIYHLEIHAVSNSYIMDGKRERRSFQDSSLQYRDMIQTIMSIYSGSDFAYRLPNEAISAFTMQFEETDWGFLKRMASRFNAGLVPDHRFQTPKFTFGIPQGQNRGKLESYNFYVKKDISNFLVSSQNWNEGLRELDAVRFCVQTEEEFLIGDLVTYLGADLYVKSVEGQIIEGALLFTYELSSQNGLSQDRLFNDRVTGLSLKGHVLGCAQDKVMVHLEIDAEQNPDTAWHFPYTTIYTAEGHAGWYCMPEVGDTVFIYFPNNREENAVSVNSIRENGGVSNPEVKIFRTPSGKELRFGNDEILVTCLDGSIFMRLNESSGIEIISSQPININTGSNMSLDASKTVNITASNEILLSCKGSSMKINNTVDVNGTVVKIS